MKDNYMNIQKIESLLKQIEDSAVITVNDSPYLHSCEILGQVENEKHETILKINWHDDEGYEYIIEFTEGNLDAANFKNNTIMLQDSENNDCVITLYNLEESLVVKNW